MRLPYESYLVRDTATGRYLRIYRPVITLRVKGPAGDDEIMGLVDTGADDTLLPDFLIKDLGVTIIPGKPAVIVGIEGSKTLVRYGSVDFSLPGYQWSSLVGFHAGSTRSSATPASSNTSPPPSTACADT